MTTSVAVRTNGSPAIGMGHVRRCLTLAQALRSDFDASVAFILNDDETARDLVGREGFEVATMSKIGDIGQTRKIIRELSATSLITDSYEIGTDYLCAIRPEVKLLVTIDDLADKYFPVDVIVNGASHAVPAIYSALPTTRMLLGPSYVLLRNEFSQEPARKLRERIHRVLITVGGSDPLNMTPRLMEWAHDSLQHAELDIVVGPFHGNSDEIKSMAAQLPVAFKLHFSPADIRTLMLEADVVITGGGQTVYELAAAGAPMIAICLAENQRSSLEGLQQEQAICYLGDVTDAGLAENLKSSLRTLDANREQRKQLSERGRLLVDGLGANRVAKAIIEESMSRQKEGTS
jgi:UDP-2,4-diacetamido-2,4,6-trideoxy-beta-L-altropyranose hydrolase